MLTAWIIGWAWAESSSWISENGESIQKRSLCHTATKWWQHPSKGRTVTRKRTSLLKLEERWEGDRLITQLFSFESLWLPTQYGHYLYIQHTDSTTKPRNKVRGGEFTGVRARSPSGSRSRWHRAFIFPDRKYRNKLLWDDGRFRRKHLVNGKMSGLSIIYSY